jgi:hypothetical protein
MIHDPSPLYRYDFVASLLDVTRVEKQILSLELLHALANMMARNGFGIRTRRNPPLYPMNVNLNFLYYASIPFLSPIDDWFCSTL